MKNKQFIQKASAVSFITTWLKNTNKKIKIGDTEIKQRDAINFYEELLVAYQNNNGRYKITGADSAGSFNISFSDERMTLKIAQDIWDNPKKYWDIEDDDNAYYEFLKFLWVEYPDGKEERLTDVVKI